MEAAKNIRSVDGNTVLSVQTYQQWFGKFLSGKFSLEDSFQSRGLSSVNIEILQIVTGENPKQIT